MQSIAMCAPNHKVVAVSAAAAAEYNNFSN